MRTSLLYLALVAILLSATTTLIADEIVTIKGTSIEGEINLSSLVIAAEEGEIEIPESSISEIRPVGAILQVRLVDGTWLEGNAVTPDVSIQAALFARRFKWSEVRHARLDLAAEGLVPNGAYLRVDDIERQHTAVERPSPLRLELDIDGVLTLPAAKKERWTSLKLRAFRSDGVSIPYVEVKKVIDKTDHVQLTLSVSISVARSYDRMIDLTVDFLSGEAGSRRYKRTFETEEGRVRTIDFYMRMPSDAFDQLFSVTSRPRLRFSLTSTEA